MTSLSLLLFAAVLCLAIYISVCTTPSAVVRKSCQQNVMRKCNKEFKKVFKDDKDAARNASVKINVYCRALQTFMNCLDRNLGSCPEGAWLSEYSFVVLEHGMMDKKCGVCPGHQFGNLENALNASSNQDYLGSEVCPPCARRVHYECVWRFLSTMKVNSNMCDDVKEFIACYKEEGDPKRSKNGCDEEGIVKKFSHLCQKQGERMLIAEESHPGLMC